MVEDTSCGLVALMGTRRVLRLVCLLKVLSSLNTTVLRQGKRNIPSPRLALHSRAECLIHRWCDVSTPHPARLPSQLLRTINTTSNQLGIQSALWPVDTVKSKMQTKSFLVWGASVVLTIIVEGEAKFNTTTHSDLKGSEGQKSRVYEFPDATVAPGWFWVGVPLTKTHI